MWGIKMRKIFISQGSKRMSSGKKVDDIVDVPIFHGQNLGFRFPEITEEYELSPVEEEQFKKNHPILYRWLNKPSNRKYRERFYR